MNFVRSTTLAMTAALTLVALPVAAQQQQGGLVNVAVNVEDNDIPVVVQVPLNLAVQVCDVAVNVLAQSIRTGTTECTIDQDTAAENNIQF